MYIIIYIYIYIYTYTYVIFSLSLYLSLSLYIYIYTYIYIYIGGGAQSRLVVVRLAGEVLRGGLQETKLANYRCLWTKSLSKPFHMKGSNPCGDSASHSEAWSWPCLPFLVANAPWPQVNPLPPKSPLFPESLSFDLWNAPLQKGVAWIACNG